MTDPSAHIANIQLAPNATKKALFTSAVSATALVCLFVLFAVQLLARL
ncbi:MAG: hypothetical protein KDE25_13110 [Novosphingobium sp.]|nr:hypothetical protein [Novosphingobium sp.]